MDSFVFMRSSEAARAGGSTPTVASFLVHLVLTGLSLYPHGVSFSRSPHEAVASHCMVVSRQLYPSVTAGFLGVGCGKCQLRVLPNCTGQSSHEAKPDSEGKEVGSTS